MSVEFGLKKINPLEQEKKNLLLKLFDANELLNSVKIENMTLLEKVKSLELELFVAREQIDRTSTSKLDDMLNVQKSIYDKTGLGFVEIGSSSVILPNLYLHHLLLLFIHLCLRLRYIRKKFQLLEELG